MVALDNNALFGQAGPARRTGGRIGLAPLVGTLAGIALALVLGAILAKGFAENGFRLGSQLAWRYTFFVFFAAVAAGPVCRIAARLLPGWTVPESLGRKLVWGFCASYGVYLLSVFLPNVISLSAGATLMVLFGGSVALVMAGTAAPLARLGAAPILPGRFRRVLLGVATAYFWSCYSLMALARISGPHRPDAFYDISLSLMLVALMLRYADHWLARDTGEPRTI